MTLLNQRIAQAGVMGMEGPWIQAAVDQFGNPCAMHYFNPDRKTLPELTLDWLHEVENTIPEDDLMLLGGEAYTIDDYAQSLADVCRRTNTRIWRATKEQRSEALLRTLGLWKEETE